jgi:hypothetical protein
MVTSRHAGNLIEAIDDITQSRAHGQLAIQSKSGLQVYYYSLPEKTLDKVA